MSEEEKTDLVEANKNPITIIPDNEIKPMGMLHLLVAKGAEPSQISQFMDLMERQEANEARKAYVVAMAKFKKDPPEIFKDRAVKYKTDKGITEYMHASLGKIVQVIGEALAKKGLSHHWDIEQQDKGLIVVTCVLTHELGHSERVPMRSLPDQSGGKNSIQAIASATTYLQRYTLLSATGLATMDMDDDGQGSEQPPETGQPEAGQPKPETYTELPVLSPTQFAKNVVAYQKLINKGSKTAEHVINMLSMKYVLSDKQKQALNAFTPKGDN